MVTLVTPLWPEPWGLMWGAQKKKVRPASQCWTDVWTATATDIQTSWITNSTALETAATTANYLIAHEEVWSEFTHRSGVPERICSPAEWWCLRGWLLAGVPLRVVLTAMKETKGKPMSLTYYRPSVQQEWERVSRALGTVWSYE